MGLRIFITRESLTAKKAAEAAKKAAENKAMHEKRRLAIATKDKTDKALFADILNKRAVELEALRNLQTKEAHLLALRLSASELTAPMHLVNITVI
jgi:hypothetical protein